MITLIFIGFMMSIIVYTGIVTFIVRVIRSEKEIDYLLLILAAAIIIAGMIGIILLGDFLYTEIYAL